MLLVTRVLASSDQARDPIASSSAKFSSKPITVQELGQLEDPVLGIDHPV
jgi:hypothetical protein